jgi:outer membrane phospholipase A
MISKIESKGLRRFILLSAAGLLFMCSISSAALVPLLSFSENTVIAGQAAEFDVYFHNEGSEALTAIIPHQLQFLATQENGSVRQLSAFGLSTETTTTLAPGSYHKKRYIMSIPADMRGAIRYKLGGFPQGAGLFLVGQAQTKPATSETSVMRTEALEQSPTLSGLETLYQTYSANFTAYQPTYFLLGADPEQSKFQISFKYRLFNPSGSLSRKFSWIGGFHLGYTQTSYWDLDSDSAPFEDTSYRPELFYVTGNIPFRPAWLDGFVIQTGMQHESNGRDGDSSRSTNYVYIKPEFIYYHQASQMGLLLSPRFLAYFNNNNDTNPDFADYRGHVELEAGFGKANSFVLKTNLRFAAEGISVQTDLTYPIHRLLGDNLDLYFQIQYSNALAESLINYRERVDAVRFGISLVR